MRNNAHIAALGFLVCCLQQPGKAVVVGIYFKLSPVPVTVIFPDSLFNGQSFLLYCRVPCFRGCEGPSAVANDNGFIIDDLSEDIGDCFT